MRIAALSHFLEQTMLQDQPSKTLLRPAVLRAAHQLIDRPLILDDPLAVGLVPEATAEAISVRMQEIGTPRLNLLRSAFVLRSRFAEDCIANAVTEGVEQLVILGAGLETFPWRQPPHAGGLQIFVTDHPASAAHARDVRARKGWNDPINVTQLDLDLERLSFVEDLERCGFKPSRPAIVTMLGLSQYLTKGAIEHIARAVANFAAPSRLTLSFNPPAVHLDGLDRELAVESPDRASTFSEPWLFQPTAAEITDLLQECGLRRVSHLTPELAQARFFAGRTDDLRAPVFEQLLDATVVEA